MSFSKSYAAVYKRGLYEFLRPSPICLEAANAMWLDLPSTNVSKVKLSIKLLFLGASADFAVLVRYFRCNTITFLILIGALVVIVNKDFKIKIKVTLASNGA